jgi:hypothetical protein
MHKTNRDLMLDPPAIARSGYVIAQHPVLGIPAGFNPQTSTLKPRHAGSSPVLARETALGSLHGGCGRPHSCWPKTKPVRHHARNRSMKSNGCSFTGKTATTNFEPGWPGKIVDCAEVHDQSNETFVEGDEVCDMRVRSILGRTSHLRKVQGCECWL